MRKTLFLTLLLAASVVSFARQADQSVIRKVAINFYYQHAGVSTSLNYNSIGIKDMTPSEYHGRIVYYTLNMAPAGWIVVAADDAVVPVLAYSFDSNLDNSSLPPQFISWMGKYSKQIEAVVSKSIPATSGISSTWEEYSKPDPQRPMDPHLLSGVAPLIIHTWDQGYPYNILCPQDPSGPGGHPYAGCVATAMCQVMFYYRFPLTGQGQHCYTPSGYAQQCADFGATTYDWNSMLNSLTGARLQNDSAIALLLWHAGVSVNMMYSASGSGAYSEDARNSLVNNFRFSSNASYIQRDDYQPEVWDSLIRSCLDRKMPLYYDGYGTGGHAFNCDGYQGSNYFHFNWGWSGTANGYYYLDNLNPDGDNFSTGEGAIINLFPDTVTNTYPYPCNSNHLLKSVMGSFTDGSSPALNYRSNSNCSWLLEPQSIEDSVQNITITFNTMNTIPGDGIIKVYKGITENDSLLAEFSGSTLPSPVTVAGAKALVTFTSGSAGTADGWFISYSGKSIDWCQDALTITDTNGTVSDGSMHFNYHNSMTCRWKIFPEGSGPITLSFTSFRTQRGHDFVKIYDYNTGEQLADYSGDYSSPNLPPPVTATSGQMFILFATDASVTDEGWEARYSAALGCNNLPSPVPMKVFPNPVSDVLTIQTGQTTAGTIKIEVSDVKGDIVLHENLAVTGNSVKLNVSGLSPGVYFMRITSGNETLVRKVIIERQ
jgi:hypothetical protein